MNSNLWNLAKILQEERLQEAAMAQYIRESRGSGPSLTKRLLATLGSLLTASYRRRKAPAPVNSSNERPITF